MWNRQLRFRIMIGLDLSIICFRIALEIIHRILLLNLLDANFYFFFFFFPEADSERVNHRHLPNAIGTEFLIGRLLSHYK